MIGPEVTPTKGLKHWGLNVCSIEGGWPDLILEPHFKRADGRSCNELGAASKL